MKLVRPNRPPEVGQGVASAPPTTGGRVVARLVCRSDGRLEAVEPVCIQELDGGRDGLDGVVGGPDDGAVVLSSQEERVACRSTSET
ncbi:hypothetical protein EAF64_20365 [Halorientalis pallida]|uniref:Uncharacterized protein n=1 Tax=Halorientalis pallida TaxID=2479928 RepID=A0A498KR46_9EURY|nr:hypothetical protein EAF64_20365 [Halorientalis pallida]